MAGAALTVGTAALLIAHPPEETATAAQGFQEAGASDASPFLDVPTDHWALPHIRALHDHDITSGCSIALSLYCPDAPVTRAEMAAFLLRVLDEEESLAPYRGEFADVPAGVWYTQHVERLSELGVTAGCATAPQRYCPGQSVNRAQMAAFIVRALGDDEGLPAYGGSFADVEGGLWYAAYVERLSQSGIAQGCSVAPPRY
jgi:hypothetical protein